MGDIIGDLNKRRGRIMGMNPDAKRRGWQVVEAEVPQAEMSSYTIDLRAMTQGRGSFSMNFCPATKRFPRPTRRKSSPTPRRTKRADWPWKKSETARCKTG